MTAQTIDEAVLIRRFQAEPPNNEDPGIGYALISVLAHPVHLDEHLPLSINVSDIDSGEFERRFDFGKEIVLYSASSTCPKAENAAMALARRGFTSVFVYRGGVADWHRAGQPTVRGDDVIVEIAI